MREMKDSNISIVGKIPINWNIKRLKYLCKIQTGDEDTQNANPEGEYPFYVRSPIIEHCDRYTFDGEGILVAGDGAGAGRIFHYALGKYAVHQRVYRLSEFIYNSRFIHYYLSNMFPSEMDKGSAQSTVPSMRLPMLLNFQLCLPPVEEGAKIVAYLDKKCSEIDALTSDIQKQIETLEQYKKSVITEAVTKGLNPDVEMKDSGVEWIGEIPVTWNVIRLKYASWLKGRIGWQGLRSDEFLDDETLPYLITGTDFVDGYVNWETCVHISEDRFMQDLAIHIEEDDLLITKDGTIGKVAVARNCPDKVSLNSGVFIIRNRGKYKYYDRYMYYLIKSNQFLIWYDLSNTGNSTIKHLNQEKFYNFLFTYPCYYEQQKIADYLDKKCSDIDSIIADKKKQLEIVAEYKKSLIYEYVTGKKEIKER